MSPLSKPKKRASVLSPGTVDDHPNPLTPTAYNFPDPPVAFRYPLSRKPGAGVPLGTRKLGFSLQSSAGRLSRCRWALQSGEQSQGVVRRVELSERAGQKRRGMAKGVAAPLAAIFAYFLSHHRK
jgi:hypothetical protein